MRTMFVFLRYAILEDGCSVGGIRVRVWFSAQRMYNLVRCVKWGYVKGENPHIYQGFEGFHRKKSCQQNNNAYIMKNRYAVRNFLYVYTYFVDKVYMYISESLGI